MTDKALAERLRKLAQAYRSVVVVDVTSINEATDLERAADLIEQMAQAEPVAWKAGGHLFFDLDAIPSHLLPPNKPAPQPLYLAPPAREPLSDEQIERVRASCVDTPAELAGRRYGWAINFARAIEQAHGIRSEK